MSPAPQFTGREFDPETGLYYYRSRYYAPQAGRFTTADPIGLLGGPNLYAYVNNNPVNWIDPWGLKGERGKSGNSVPKANDIIQWTGFDQQLAQFGVFYNVERIEGTMSINGEQPSQFQMDFHQRLITNMPFDMKFTISQLLRIDRPFSVEVFGTKIEGHATFYVRVGFGVHKDEGNGEGTGAPEPGTLVLAGLGVAAIGISRRRKRNGINSLKLQSRSNG